ncbi:MAG: NHL repeat-containing protein [Actinobacteria bacterium]|nr:NHL repeat-containing protein [Actinomycetota bacterium]
MWPPAVGVGYASNGALLQGAVSSPQAIAYGFAKLFVADTANDRFVKTDLAGFARENFGSSGSAAGQLRWPAGIAITDSAVVFVADTGNDRISVWSFGGVFGYQFGARGSAPGQFLSPHGIAVIPNGPFQGDLAIADTGNDRIQIVTRTGGWLATIGSSGSAPGQLSSPTSVSVWGDDVFVADTGNQRIQRLTLDGRPNGVWGGEGADGGCTMLPTGILANEYGVWVAEAGGARIERFTRWGTLLDTVGGFASPSSVAMDDSGRFFVTDTNRVVRVAPVASVEPPLIFCNKADPVGCLS